MKTLQTDIDTTALPPPPTHTSTIDTASFTEPSPAMRVTSPGSAPNPE